MPNRIIKESIVSSDNLNELTPEQEVFFYRLMVICDDFGRMDARPQILLAKCFPLKTSTIKLAKINEWLDALIQHDLVQLYDVDGKSYLIMSSWDKHQQKRAKKSKYPEPPAFSSNNNNLLESDIICNQVQTNVPEKRETRNEKREGGTENKKPPAPSKIKYAEFVTMTEGEHQVLVAEHGPDDTARLIEILNLYKGANGRTYKSDFMAIKKWGIKALAEEKHKSNSLRQQNKARAPNETPSAASVINGGKYTIFVPPGGE